MKPILFNTEMVRAILDGRKTVTRRVVTPQPRTECDHGGQHEFIRDDFTEGSGFNGFVCKKCGYGVCGPHFKFPVGTSWLRPPYRPGDILYMRETFFEYNGHYYYKADGKHEELAKIGIRFKWRPSIHMPKEAARMFLRVKDVRVERLQAPFFAPISPIFALQREGIDIGEQCLECIENYGNPCCVDTVDEDGTDEYGGECGMLDEVRRDLSDLWDSTIKPADRALYGWAADPWVWVIEFERVTKEETENG